MALIDARTLPDGSEISADLVIIGGGMAAIALAREWMGANKRVAILESGGLEFDEETQDLYRGAGLMRAPDNPEKPIDEYLYQSRYRALGGSGAIWGGKCVPLDPADFAARDWLPLTGWPITREQLQPFYDRACALLKIPLFDRDWNTPQEENRPPLVIGGARDFFSAPRCFSPLSGAVEPERFNQFRTGFTDAGNLDVYLHANVVEIRRRGRQVRELAVACLNGRRHVAHGRAYVLATGGIENVRLLLASGIESESGYLGRCFMGHVTFGAYDATAPMTILTVSDASRSMALYTDNRRDRFHCVIAATLEGQRRFGIGNCTTTLFPLDGEPAPESAAVLALSAALDQGALSAPAARALGFFAMSEQLPNPESCITLDASSTDALGMPRVRLEWTYSRRDMDNLERAVFALASALGAENLGRMCWPLARDRLLTALSPSRHHMGTTRMSVDPEHGVVDANCRMHGLRNLYVAGSSVFPTSGIANPTLTIIALTMRLSDTLKQNLGARA